MPDDRRLPRRGVIAVLPVLYVAGATAYTGEDRPLAWIAIVAGALIALRGWKEDKASPVRAGLALAVATSALSIRTSWGASLREVSALVVTLAAARVIRTLDGDMGLAARATEAVPGLKATQVAKAISATCATAWGTSLLVDVLAWTGSASAHDLAPVVAAAAGAISLFALGVGALGIAALRKLELAVTPRALAAAAAVGIALVSALALSLASTLSTDGATALAATIAGATMVRILKNPDALRLARRSRRALTLLLFGGPVVTLAAISSHNQPLVTMVLALLAMLVGAFANRLEEPLLPLKGRLLDALAEATLAAHDRDAREAIVKALLRVRQGCGEKAASPELWILNPTRIHTIDAASYLTERDAELPLNLLDIAAGEPHHTIRLEVLRALEVRRADLRPLLKWMEDRGALYATLISGGEEPDGVLIVPAGLRTESVALEEIHASQVLADSFVAVCQARSAHQRHLAREVELRERLDVMDDELAAVRHAATLDEQRNELASARLARPATIGIYSAASRLSYDAIERRIERNAPLVISARAGIDPVPFIARAHLAGPRRRAPLVIVDGTSSREHDLERWKDRSASPIGLADRGLLVLVDGAALPRDVQVLIARSLGERRPPWERATPLDIALAFSATSLPEHLVEENRLAPELFGRFEESEPIELPGLRDRAEDLFSIVADRLAREGLRVRGRPVGIDANAYSRLVDHPFEGEDAELDALVSRLVAVSGDVVRAADIDRIMQLSSTARPSNTG